MEVYQQRKAIALSVAVPLSALVLSKVLLLLWKRLHRHRGEPLCSQTVEGFLGCIGNTPLVKINSLSELTGCLILGKAEFLNPGGSVKDRVAKQMIDDAEAEGVLKASGTIFEGTAGTTGISLALVARAKKYNCHIYMPDDQAKEKVQLLEKFGAIVTQVRPVSIIDKNHFCNMAKRHAQEQGNSIFTDQFENLSNFRAHYRGTGPEIWQQAAGRIDAFVCAAGTGGTIAGISTYLKEQDPSVKVFLIDPPGSSLYNKVVNGVLFTKEEAEGKRVRHPFDTVTEGIGINRLTRNFAEAKIDSAFRGTDQEAVDMSRFLLRNDGLFVGSSSAMNCVGAVKAARQLGPGHVIVTVLCDSGTRHLTKFHNDEYLAKYDLLPKSTGNSLDFVL